MSRDQVFTLRPISSQQPPLAPISPMSCHGSWSKKLAALWPATLRRKVETRTLRPPETTDFQVKSMGYEIFALRI